MKKAFTLVELMVVVVVISILLAIVFRLVGLGEDSSKRNTTIARMQRIENALSGYFAAFGSYPPVALYQSRNVYARLDTNGKQTSGSTGSLEWESVQKACQAQPMAVRFPFRSDAHEYVNKISAIIVSRVNSSDAQWARYRTAANVRKFGGGFHALSDPNDVSGWQDSTSWDEVKIFQFGVMSYLLPRYLFMTKGIKEEDLNECAQWEANNRLSSHPNTGKAFSTWKDQMKDGRLVKRIPSQAVCARWMANFEGMVSGNPICPDYMKFFGVNVSDGSMLVSAGDKNGPPSSLEVYLDQNRTILDSMTVKDGWGSEFYYYSPPPFQSYRLWSAGQNEVTFPPWVPLETLKSDADRKTAAEWMSDDIMYLSN